MPSAVTSTRLVSARCGIFASATTESRLRATAATTHSQRTTVKASATVPQFGPRHQTRATAPTSGTATSAGRAHRLRGSGNLISRAGVGNAAEDAFVDRDEPAGDLVPGVVVLRHAARLGAELPAPGLVGEQRRHCGGERVLVARGRQQAGLGSHHVPVAGD